MATGKNQPPLEPAKRGRGRLTQGKEDWQVAGYRLPPGLREEIRKAFHRAAAAGQEGPLRYSISVEMDKPPASMNEFVAALLGAASRSI